MSDGRGTSSAANGRRSRGPKTDGGKGASSRNATRHGLQSLHAVVLPSESEAEWETHLAEMRAAIGPRDYIERIFAESAAYYSWKLRRARRAETEALAATPNVVEEVEYHPHSVEALLADLNPPPRPRPGPHREPLLATKLVGLELLDRYATSAERGFLRTLTGLRRHRGHAIEPDPDPDPAD